MRRRGEEEEEGKEYEGVRRRAETGGGRDEDVWLSHNQGELKGLSRGVNSTVFVVLILNSMGLILCASNRE